MRRRIHWSSVPPEYQADRIYLKPASRPQLEARVMAQKRHEQTEFTVTDRRLFTSDGELRSEAREEELPKAPAAADAPKQTKEAPAEQAAAQASEQVPTGETDHDIPPPPTSAEQEAQAAAYRQSSKD